MPTPIRETLSLRELQKHKHMPKEFRGKQLGLLLQVWRPLVRRAGGPPTTPLFFQDFSKELTQGPPPSDATPPTSGRCGRHAVEECCYISSSLFDAPEMCCAEQMKGLGALQQLLRTSLNRELWLGGGGLAFGWYFWVHLQKTQKHIL